MSLRISSTQIADNSIYGISEAYSRFAKAQSEVNTGKQLQQPSDNPSGLAQSLNFKNQLDQVSQYQRNISQANSFLSTTDTALANVNDLLRQARTIAVQAGSSTVTDESRQALVAQVQNIISQVTSIGNTTNGTRYIFAGQRTDSAPFASSSAYVGGSDATGDGAITLDIGRSDTLQINVPGDKVITPVITALTTLKNDLSAGNSNVISNTDIANFDTQINNVINIRADVGSKIQGLQTQSTRYALTKDNLTKLISNIEDADYAKTVIEYQTAQTSYQAAIQSTAKVFQTSLLDFLK